MDHSAMQRRLYDLLNAGDIERFGALLADGDFRVRAPVGGQQSNSHLAGRERVDAGLRAIRRGFAPAARNSSSARATRRGAPQ